MITMIYETYSISLESLTPIHIGDGTKLIPMDYCVEGNTFYAIDHERFFRSLPKEGRDRLISLIQRMGASFSLKRYMDARGLRPKPYSIYGIRCEPREPREVLRFVKDSSNLVYIPGSSLKGAIRTAILHKLLKEDEKRLLKALERVESTFEETDPRMWRDLRKRIGNKVEEVAVRQGKKDPYYDALRFIQTTDSMPQPPEKVLAVQEVRVFREKGRTLPFSIFLEVVMKGCGFQGFLVLHRSLRPLLQSKKETDKPFSDEELLYNLEKQSSTIANKDFILKACNELSRDLLEHEISFAGNTQIESLRNFYMDLKAMRLSADECLIRLGWAQGLLSTTLRLLLKERRAYQKISRPLGLGSAGEPFPRTRRLLVKEGIPLGWAKMSIKEYKGP